jgi:hypothetical protein
VSQITTPLAAYPYACLALLVQYLAPAKQKHSAMHLLQLRHARSNLRSTQLPLIIGNARKNKARMGMFFQGI